MQLERIGERVELSYNKRRVIVSTVHLPGGVWESMAMYKSDGAEIESRQTQSREKAERNHAELVKKYTPKEKPAAPALTGKYKKLAEDLKRARDSALRKCARVDDGGTCNFDAPALYLPRWNGELVKAAAKAAGVGAFKWESFGPVKWVFTTRSGAQGNKNSAVAEYMMRELERAGYSGLVYAQMD